TPPGPRSKSFPSSAASREEIRVLTVGWVKKSLCAAVVKDPVSTTARKASMSRISSWSSITEVYSIREIYQRNRFPSTRRRREFLGRFFCPLKQGVNSMTAFSRNAPWAATLAFLPLLMLQADAAPPAAESRAFHFEYSTKVTGFPQ